MAGTLVPRICLTNVKLLPLALCVVMSMRVMRFSKSMYEKTPSDHNIVLIVQVAVFQVFRLRGFTASNNENISV